MKGPLSDIIVLDNTHVLAGPFAGRLLGELGALVIKIEPPYGEMGRRLGYHWFASVNANKKFIAINLKDDEGRKILYELVKKSDVFLTNYKYSTVIKLGLSYEDLKKINPKIIYLQLTGFGTQGPYKDVPAHDIILQSLSGMAYTNGFPNDPPIRCGPPVIDVAAGLCSALSIVSALYYREKSGEGQFIDIALYDAAIMLMIEHLAYYFMGYPERLGNANPMQTVYNIFKAKDGYVAVVTGEDNQWNALLKIMRREDLKDDQRFKTLPERSKHRTIIDEIVESWTKNISLRDAEQLMTSVDFPVAPVRHLESILTDPQVKERQMIVKLPHPILNEVITPGSCLKLSKTPGKVESAGYPVGYHTEEILKSLLGYEDDYIKALREKGVIV